MLFHASIHLPVARAKVRVKVLFIFFNVDGCSGSFFWFIRDQSLAFSSFLVLVSICGTVIVFFVLSVLNDVLYVENTFFFS